LPFFSEATSPASRKTAKWADIVGFDTSNSAANSPAVLGPFLKISSTRRRVGSDSALNTLVMILYLANHLNDVNPQKINSRKKFEAVDLRRDRSSSVIDR
jgi:hypothetical protein